MNSAQDSLKRMFVGNDVQHMHHVFLKFVYTPKIETKNPKDSSSIIF